MIEPTSQLTPAAKQTTEIIYAGGTISSIATADGYREGGHVIDLVSELARRMPTFRERFSVGKPTVAYTGLSENLEPKYWAIIEEHVANALKRHPHAILITHGTDSMEQTARYLQKKFLPVITKQKTKIIITAANDDILHPKTDAWENLMFSFESASSNAPANVYVAFRGRLIPADVVVKEPFNGREMNYASMKDKAYQESMSRVKNHSDWLISKLERVFEGVTPDTARVKAYDVSIFREDHHEFLADIEAHPTRAVLLNLYHSGTANTENPRMSVAKLIKKLRTERKIVSFVVTENNSPVDLHAYETSVQMRLAGGVPLYDMPREVALAKLQYLVKSATTPVALIQEMLKARADEIDENLIISDDIRQLIKLYKG
ncbi:MAG TPA: asparaginase domain-containing protein [Candidatus Saccharimonadia bacterium]|jgi:L-asparaginase/Glu-tRNA(Gln) amidotransferase subunit D|nr:asparaginase domain-containing protein [Candidatus Saccharimonadia bacterium]